MLHSLSCQRRAPFRKRHGVRLRDIKGRFACHCEFAHFSAHRHLTDAFSWLQEEFFQREVNTEVLASLRDGKQFNFGANYREADRGWQMCCLDEGPAAGSAARGGVKPLSSSQQARDTREQADKDVRTCNYTPGTCEIRALEVLVKNNAPRWWSQAVGEGLVQGWEWDVGEEVLCLSSCWRGPAGHLARGLQSMRTGV